MVVADLEEGHGSHHIFTIKRSPHHQEKLFSKPGSPIIYGL